MVLFIWQDEPLSSVSKHGGDGDTTPPPTGTANGVGGTLSAHEGEEDKVVRRSTVTQGTPSDTNPESGRRSTARSGGNAKKLDDLNFQPKVELNEKQKKDIRAAFDAFDSKGTGQMEARELKVIGIRTGIEMNA